MLEVLKMGAFGTNFVHAVAWVLLVILILSTIMKTVLKSVPCTLALLSNMYPGYKNLTKSTE